MREGIPVKAIVQDRYGSVEALELRDVERPVPGAGEVLTRVRAAGVGPDVWHLMTGKPYFARLGGTLGLRGPKHPVRGWDVAGVVEAVGDGVTSFRPGDEVFGFGNGSFAEYCLAKAGELALKPADISFEEAASLPVSGCTALQAMHAASPGVGSKVLVIGASGGVGGYAVQLAAARGARVTAVCRADAGELVRSLGAVDVLDYTEKDITAGPGRYDLIVDNAGNRPLSRLRRVLAPRGTILFVGGEEKGPLFGGTDRWVRGLVLSRFVGQTLRPLISVPSGDDLASLGAMAGRGSLRAVVDRSFPLPEAAAAVRHLREGHPRGKVVLSI